MKLISLGIYQLKKFDAPTRLENLDGGLNVVIGPNEMGKSTVLDGLRAVLFEKHNSKAQPIRELQNEANQSAPVIALTFDLDGGRYRIKKRFLKKPYAELSCPDGRTLQGETAEDELRAKLGFGEPNMRGAQPDSLGTWSVLWVQQGESFGAPTIPASARSDLHSALETEVGTVLGGRRGRALPVEVERQLSELVSQKAQKPRGPYKQAIEHVEKLESELDELQQRRSALDTELDELERSQAILARVKEQEANAEEDAKLANAREQRKAVEELERQISEAEQQLKLRQAELDAAENERQQRETLKARVRKTSKAIKDADETHRQAAEAEAETRAHVEKLRQQRDDAEREIERLDKEASRQRKLSYAAARQREIKQLEDALENAQQAETDRRELERAIAAIRIDKKGMEALRDASNKLENARAALHAVSTGLRAELRDGAQEQVCIAGEPVWETSTYTRIVEATRIDVEGVGAITVEPVVHDRDTLIANREEAEEHLNELLEKVGAQSVDDAERQLARKQDLQQREATARNRVEAYAPATAERNAGAQALSDQIAGLQNALQRECDELGVDELPTPEDADNARKQAEGAAEEARQRYRAIRASLEGPENTLRDQQDALAAAKTNAENARARYDEAKQEFDAAEQQASDEALAARRQDAEQQRDGQHVAVESLKAQRGTEDLDQIDARIDRLEQAIANRQQKRQQLEVDISRLKASIETQEGAGLDEAIARKRRELELANTEKSRYEHEVAVLALLRDTLRAAESEAKERYLSPILTRVHRYLQQLFPHAEIRLNEDLDISGLVRENGFEEPFRNLSAGTQEQIAVLVRLAFGEMLAEQGRPAMIVLDDALVFSDDARIDKMFDILSAASKRLQIVILTCREQLFESLGGHKPSMVEGDREELQSA